MEDDVAAGDKVVGDNPPMTTPPHRFSAHNGAALRLAQMAQTCKAAMESRAHGVVGEIMEALVRPECVDVRRDVALSSAQCG